MITYVNTVLVGKGTPVVIDSWANVTTANANKYVIMDVDSGNLVAANATAGLKRIKIGMITAKTSKDQKGVSHPIIKWSNIINRADVKSCNLTTYSPDSEDTVFIDFTSADISVLDDGNKRVLVRLTFKDTPTRYRKWTDTYEYVTAVGDTKAKIAAGIAAVINKEWKRSRVEAVVGSLAGTTFTQDSNWGTSTPTTGNVVKIVALPYDDDDAVDTINVAGKIRFTANAYYTDPQAAGFASKNKYSINNLSIIRVPGNYYTASAKLVRDREAQAMGYDGILNRGNGTWPIIKPDMNVSLSAHYNSLTLEFENMYRAADDIFRKTKQTVEIYDYPASGSWAASNSTYASIVTAIDNFMKGKTGYDEAQDAIIEGKADK